MVEDLISEIHAAPLASDPWTNCLTRLKYLVGSDRIMLHVDVPDSPECAMMATDLESEQLYKDLYWNEYRFIDPIPYRSVAPGQIFQFEDVMDLDALFASDFYLGLCSLIDSRHAFFCNLGTHDGREVSIRSSRNTSKGRYSLTEMDNIRALMPHLIIAAKTFCRLERYRTENNFYANVVADLGIGVVSLDCAGRVIAANAESQRLIKRRNGDPDGRMMFIGCDTEQQARALRLLDDGKETVVPIVGEDDQGRPLGMVMRRAHQPALGQDGVSVYATILVAPDDYALSKNSVNFVSRAWGLTPSEARLCILLASGYDLKSIAEKLDITTTTARTYCKRVLVKMGVSKQSDVVRLIYRSFVGMA